MKTIIKEYGKKLLSLVMAVVMTLTLVNLAPFAQEAKAASTLYFHADGWSSAYLWAWGGYSTSTWPGEALTKVDGTNGWWSLTINADSFTGYVQETGGGRGCDKSFSVSGGGEKYVVFANDTSTAYGTLAEAEAAAGEALFPSAVEEYPDVVITDISWSPASPQAGDAVTFTATIKNQGTVATPAGKTGVAFTVNGGSKTWNGDYTTSIPAGGSITLTANNGESGTSWTATEGTFTVTATIDDTGYTESDTANNSYSENITVAAAAVTTFNFTFVDGTTEGWLDEASAYFEVVVDGTTYSMSGGSGTWTATIPTSASSITVNRKNPSDGATWNSWSIDGTARGTETTYTATGYDDTNKIGYGQWGTVTPSVPTTTTITFKSENSGIQADDARIYVIEGTIASGSYKDGNNVMTSGVAMTETTDGTWTATVTSDVITFVRVSNSGAGNYYWGWQWENTSRGTETVFTATGNGAGYWGEGSSEEPSTAAPTGDIYGTPLTDTEIKDLSHLELEDVVDVNSGAEELFVVPGIFYNYKSGGGSAWWDQFRNLDNQIISTYYGTGKMEYPLVIGAPDTVWDDTDAQGDRALNRLMNYKTDETITSVEALYYINHNLSNGPHDGWSGIGSGSAVVQNLVAQYLSTEGQLLSSENNVIMPFFDDNFLGTTGDSNVVDGTWATKYGNSDNPLSFPFRVEGDYYVFDSASGTDNIRVENEKIVYDSSSSAQIKNGFADYTGFYPFDTSADSGNADALTYGFGARLDIPFNVVNGDASKATPTVASKTASIGWNNDSVQTWTVDLGTTLTAGQTYTIVLDSNMGGGITWDYLGIDGQTKYFGDTSWYSVEGDVSYLAVGDINSSYNCLSKIDGKIAFTITPSSNISNFTLHGKTYNTNYNLGVNVYSGSKTLDSIVYPPEDIVFNFTGDDDLWVYVDGKLVLDMGGAHGQASGNINFTDGTVTVNDAFAMNYDTNAVSATGVTTSNVDWIKFDDPTVTHTMTVFYMERGLYDSNLKISFNFNPVRLTQRNGLTVSNTVDLSDINNGFLTDLDAYDFDFTYDAYDVTDYNLSGNKDLLFYGGSITITGDGSKTAYLEQEHTDGTGTIRGDEAKVTQNQYANFDTSYELINTSGNVINSSTSNNPYNVVDGKVTDGETEDVYFELEDGSGSDSNLHIEAAFTNKAKVTSITLAKLDNSIAHEDSDQYTFIVEYTKLLGVAKTGFFTGEYTITDTRDSSTRTASTSNGEITIYAYEVVTINGVPVDSEIRISEKNDGNYIKTVVTTSAAEEIEIDNDAFYTITSDDNVTYDWQIVNGDKNTAVYFAEVGTAIIINCGDELANIQSTSTSTTGEFRYQVEVPADTITVNAPGSDAVTGGADLVVTDISWGGTDIAVGDDVVFTVTVKNVGDTAVPANEVIGLDIVIDGNTSNTLWCDTYANGLAPGATVTLTINGGTSGSTWTATDGSHTFRANIDDRGTVDEVNESNNYYEITLTTPYEAGGIEQRVVTATYSYHEEIIAGTVSGTIGTVTHTKDSITYTYPGSSAPGEDVFYYEVAQIADSDVVVNGETIVKAGEVYYTTSTAAKVYSYQGNDDVYVIDYGLPVSLTAEPNNMRANDITTLSGVATDLVEYGFIGTGSTLSSAAAATGLYKAAQIGYITAGSAVYGSVAANGTDAANLNNWNYSLAKFMDGIETFYYGFQVVADGTDVETATLNAANATPVMNSKVTVVPASVVYYEDNFSYDSTSGTTSAITYTGDGVVVNNTGLDITQSNSLDDLYGFDEAYDNMIGDGNGSTMLEKSQKVSFTFKGTGFDIVARTADTATVLYVVSKDGKLVEMGNVDTYYDAGVLYQLPVISVKDLEYGEYTVQFMILSSSAYSEFYFDGIRIYNPLGAGSEYYNSYENGAKVTPIIDMILGDCTFTETGIYDADGNLIESTNTVPDGSQITVVGDMITEDLGSATVKNGSALADLLSDGPNNEVYLGNGSKLVFYATPNNEVANDADRTLQVEVKAASNKMEMVDVVVDNKSAWVATASSGTPSNAIDGVIATRWEGSYQRSETERKWFQVDMAKEYTFDAINLALGSSTNDWPANYEVFVSNDGTEWTSVKTGAGAAGLETIYLGTTTARYVRIEQWGVRYSNYWSIHEFGLKSVVRNTNPSSYTNKYKWSVIDANCDTNNTSRLIDNKTADRWTSYAMTDRQTEDTAAYFVVDLGVNYDFDTVQMFLGTSTNDQPDNYKISVSNDNVNWTAVASGTAAGGTEEYSVGAQNARYVKVEGWGGTNYWSVHEFGIANKSATDADTGLDLSLNSTNDVIANIDTNTAMYYEIPMSLCSQQPDGSYLVVINGASNDDYNLSFTNLKVKGYDITPYETATSSSSVYITNATVDGKSNISFNRKTEVEFVLTLSADAPMSKDNLSLTANGNDVNIRSVEAVEGTSNQYIVKTLAPQAIGTFTYNFAYTNADGKVAVTSVNAKVTASRSR